MVTELSNIPEVTEEEGGMRVHFNEPAWCGLQLINSLRLSIPTFFDHLDETLAMFNGDMYDPDCICELAAKSAGVPVKFIEDLPEEVFGNVAAVVIGWLEYSAVWALAAQCPGNRRQLRKYFRALGRKCREKGGRPANA